MKVICKLHDFGVEGGGESEAVVVLLCLLHHTLHAKELGNLVEPVTVMDWDYFFFLYYNGIHRAQGLKAGDDNSVVSFVAFP